MNSFFVFISDTRNSASFIILLWLLTQVTTLSLLTSHLSRLQVFPRVIMTHRGYCSGVAPVSGMWARTLQLSFRLLFLTPLANQGWIIFIKMKNWIHTFQSKWIPKFSEANMFYGLWFFLFVRLKLAFSIKFTSAQNLVERSRFNTVICFCYLTNCQNLFQVAWWTTAVPLSFRENVMSYSRNSIS